MKKIFYFFKNFKNKFYLKLIDILLEAEKPQLPKELRNNLDIFRKNTRRNYFFYIYSLYDILDMEILFYNI